MSARSNSGPDRGLNHNATHGAPANQQTRQMRPNPPGCIARFGSEAGLRSSKQNREAMRPKKTILCVDDNEQILSVRTFLLETRGYRVLALVNPHEALEAISHSLPGSIDLLLCDLIMPLMDGNELVRRAKQINPTLPAMIVSGTVAAYDRAGRADVFLPKGAGSPAELLERIRILVARKRGPRKTIVAPPQEQPMTAVAVSA
jgi:CheY-like chemotaxis protein